MKLLTPWTAVMVVHFFLVFLCVIHHTWHRPTWTWWKNKPVKIWLNPTIKEWFRKKLWLLYLMAALEPSTNHMAHDCIWYYNNDNYEFNKHESLSYSYAVDKCNVCYDIYLKVMSKHISCIWLWIIFFLIIDKALSPNYNLYLININ